MVKQKINDAWKCRYCDKKFPKTEKSSSWEKITYKSIENKRLYEIHDPDDKYLNHLHLCDQTKEAFCPKRFCVQCRCESILNENTDLPNFRFDTRAAYLSHQRIHHKNNESASKKPKETKRRSNLEIKLQNQLELLIKRVREEREEFIIDDDDINILDIQYTKISKIKPTVKAKVKRNKKKEKVENLADIDFTKNVQAQLDAIAAAPDESSEEEEPLEQSIESDISLDENTIKLDYDCNIGYYYFMNQLKEYGVDFDHESWSKDEYDNFVSKSSKEDYDDGMIRFDTKDLVLMNLYESLEIYFERAKSPENST